MVIKQIDSRYGAHQGETTSSSARRTHSTSLRLPASAGSGVQVPCSTCKAVGWGWVGACFRATCCVPGCLYALCTARTPHSRGGPSLGLNQVLT